MKRRRGLPNVVMFFKCIRLSGVSLGASMSGLPSFRCTSAHLSIKLSENPDAIRPIVPIVQGIITIPIVLKLPLRKDSILHCPQLQKIYQGNKGYL